ncbi:MAG: CBS domain containing-hemolysin-like protein [Rubritalea sp.]|jgi:CBS domain containing-hemolysin-like protein|tara:strand:- start:24315 stop:25337 length:1023 start_codon:yes stop_codon:yes gene_type:complete
MTTLLIAALLVILISALCSGTEAALFSVPIMKVRQMADEQCDVTKRKLGTKSLLIIREKMSRPISMIVILNNIANIGGTTIVTLLAKEIYSSLLVGVISGSLTFMVIIFAEIIPKTIGEKHNLKISLFMAKPVLFLTKILTPLIWLVELLTRPFTGKDRLVLSTDEREIRYMAQLGEEEGVIEADELEMLHGVFQLNDMDARALMTPRISLTCIDGDVSIKSVIDEVIGTQHSRIVVIGESRDDVVCVVLKSSLLIAMIKGQGEDKVRLHGYEPVEVLHEMKADSILPIFQKSRQHLAIVRDEFGGVDGVITLEDIIEELTGEIVDETDMDEDMREAAAS